MGKFVFIIVLLFLSIQAGYARSIKLDDVLSDSYHIQIGAFGNQANVNNAIKKLYNFDVYIEPYKNLNRVIVVNIMTKGELKQSFSKIKKIYPKAFISKRAISATKKSIQKKPVKNYNKLFQSSSKKREIIQQYDDTLNSNTILKTRKSFL